MERIVLLIALLYAISVCSAQDHNDFVVAGQIGTNTLMAKPYDASILLGMKTEEGDQFLIGPQFMRFGGAVGHKQSYWGGRIHAQADMLGVYPFLNVGFLYGDHYLFVSNLKPPTIRQNAQLHGTLGVGFMIKERAGVFVGYGIQEYNPGKYHQRGVSPYQDGAFSVKLSVNTSFGNGFATNNIGQRRMW